MVGGPSTDAALHPDRFSFGVLVMILHITKNIILTQSALLSEVALVLNTRPG
jgi:hypothetical protein